MDTILHKVIEEGRSFFTIGFATVLYRGTYAKVPMLLYFDLTHGFVQSVLKLVRRYGSCDLEVRVGLGNEMLRVLLRAISVGEEIPLELSFSGLAEYRNLVRRLRNYSEAVLQVYSFTSDRTGYYRLVSSLSCNSIGENLICFGKVEKIFEGDLENMMVREIWPREGAWVSVHELSKRALSMH